VSSAKRLVLDANILLRGEFGSRVRQLLETCEDTADFYSPDVCFSDAGHYVVELSQRRSIDPAIGLSVLDGLAGIIVTVDLTLYQEYEETARERIAMRDVEDWPIVASALLLDAPIWTEDQDFFGIRVATWITSNVDLYLRDG
jgi:predicted nucleic acid-binding protein